MQLGELAGLGLTIEGDAGRAEIAGLTADSRAVGRDFLFAALPGSTTDGARYVPDAVAKGATAILVGRDVRLDPLPGVVVLRADDPRRALALVAARFHPRQPDHLVAVTGTAGKTSVAAFARQIFERAGYASASMGTLGVVSRRWSTYGSLTTPDPIALHAGLDRLAREGVTHAAIEASSHGLDQRRLDGIRIEAAGFTNLGRDHMDYHATVADYLAAKMRLFSAILPEGKTAVVDMDDAHSPEVVAAVTRRRQALIRTGRRGSELKLLSIAPSGFRQMLDV